MLSPRLMILFFRKNSLLNIFMWLMGLGIFILVDCFSTMWLASLIGAYLSVAVVGIITWLSLAIVFASMSRHIRLVRRSTAQASLPKIEFMHISGLTICALLIITPGLVTDVLGWILYLPPLRLAIGSVVYRKFHREFEEVHQHLTTE